MKVRYRGCTLLPARRMNRDQRRLVRLTYRIHRTHSSREATRATFMHLICELDARRPQLVVR